MPTESRISEYIGSREAMELMGLSRTTFYRHVQDGKIPCVRAVHRWVFHRETLVAWREQMLAPSRVMP